MSAVIRFKITLPPASVVALEAPAGFGKTVLVSQLAEHLASGSAEVARLSGSDVESAEPLHGLSNGPDRPGGVQWLLIDDAGDVPAGYRQELIRFALQPGARTRMLLVGRVLEGFHLARHVASSRIGRLEPQALLLSRAALHAVYSGRLNPSHIEALHHLTEGWAAPTRLLGAFLAGGGSLDDDGVHIERSMAGQFVAEELLAELPEGWLPVAARTHPRADAR